MTITKLAIFNNLIHADFKAITIADIAIITSITIIAGIIIWLITKD